MRFSSTRSTANPSPFIAATSEAKLTISKVRLRRHVTLIGQRTTPRLAQQRFFSHPKAARHFETNTTFLSLHILANIALYLLPSLPRNTAKVCGLLLIISAADSLHNFFSIQNLRFAVSEPRLISLISHQLVYVVSQSATRPRSWLKALSKPQPSSWSSLAMVVPAR